MGTDFWIMILVMAIIVLVDPLLMIIGDISFSRGGGAEGRGKHLIFFVKKSDTNKVRKLLARDSSRHWLDDKDEYGMTALMYAAKEGHEDIVRILLDEGADVNKVCSKMTALNLAEQNGHTAIVELLKEPTIRRGDGAQS
jgi:hypothetical protein